MNDAGGAAPEYLTAAELGQLLRLSAKSVYRLAKSDPSFPMLKLASAVRFPRSRVLRWLADREQGRGRARSEKSA